jgi:hypothetical protein
VKNKLDPTFYARAINAKNDAIKKCLADIKSIKSHPDLFPKVSFTRAQTMALMDEFELKPLRSAIPYHWDKDVFKLAIIAGKKIPKDTLFEKSWLHSRAGWWWLGDDTPLRGIDSIEDMHKGIRISAILYQLKEETNQISLMGFTSDHSENTSGLVPAASMSMELDLTLGQQVDLLTKKYNEERIKELTGDQDRESAITQDFSYSCRETLYAFFAGSLWMQQKIIETTKLELPKAVTRNLYKYEVEPKSSYVVQLRKKDYEKRADGKGKEVSWQFRWIVGADEGGFWNKYHTKNGTILKWIEPFIKGPSDKPLKPVANKIFHISR